VTFSNDDDRHHREDDGSVDREGDEGTPSI